MNIKVVEIKENPDGSAEYIFEVDEETKAYIMKVTKMKKRWSKKKFEKLVIDALKNFEAKHESSKES